MWLITHCGSGRARARDSRHVVSCHGHQTAAPGCNRMAVVVYCTGLGTGTLTLLLSGLWAAPISARTSTSAAARSHILRAHASQTWDLLGLEGRHYRACLLPAVWRRLHLRSLPARRPCAALSRLWRHPCAAPCAAWRLQLAFVARVLHFSLYSSSSPSTQRASFAFKLQASSFKLKLHGAPPR